MLSEAEALKLTAPLRVLPPLGAVNDTLGAVLSEPAAWVTVKVWPAIVMVPERELVLVLAATE